MGGRSRAADVRRMRRRRIAGIALCLALALMAVVAAQQMDGVKGSFDGSRVCNADAYVLTFSEMNRQDGHSMHMEAGDALRVEYAIAHGRVDVRVETEYGELVYRGDRMDSGSFVLPALRAGAFRVSVRAEHAAGSLSFIVERDAGTAFS